MSRMGLRCALTIAVSLNGLAIPAHANDALFEAVRRGDMQVATIGWRLASANVTLCDRQETGTGMQIHTLDQFDAAVRDEAKRHFGFATGVAVEGVVAGSPAEQAGLKPDDSLLRVGPIDMEGLPGKGGTTDRLVAAQRGFAGLPADKPIEVDAIRAGAPIHMTIQPLAVCRSRFELELNDNFTASADGEMVQIGSGFLEAYPEEQVAAVIGHEFSHNILRHRDRLEARGVHYGLLAGFGANVKYFRQTEVQADLLSVYLLANADYPIEAPAAFWRLFGPSKAGGILRSRDHPAWRDRLATLEAEAAKVEKMSTRPVRPAFLADRGKPLDGDWKALLIRHR